MTIFLLIAFASVPIFFATLLIRRRAQEFALEQRSISPEALYELRSKRSVLLIDLRQPLDVLAHSEIIPGALKVFPKEVLQNPYLLPTDQDVVVYCTCPEDTTTLHVLQRALAMNLSEIKFLKGGLDAWKRKGFPVVPYDAPFHLDGSRISDVR